MAHANWRLDNPPVVDVAVSRRMGLFVVARLAARHGIRVRLRPASGAGLTALVWLPDEVVVREAATRPGGLGRFPEPLARFAIGVAPAGITGPIDPGGALPAGLDADFSAGSGEWPAAGPSTAEQEVAAARMPRFAPPELDEQGSKLGPQRIPGVGPHPGRFGLGSTGPIPAVEADSPGEAAAYGAGFVPQPGVAGADAGSDSFGTVPTPAFGGEVPAVPSQPFASEWSAPAEADGPGDQPAQLAAAVGEGQSAVSWPGDQGTNPTPVLPGEPEHAVLGAPVSGSRGSSGTFLSQDSGRGSTNGGVIVPPAASLGGENRLPIFEAVESDWFRRGRPTVDVPGGRADRQPVRTWTSPADEGWKAAEAAAVPSSSGTTLAGLPRRVPRANLIPGTAAETVTPGPVRSAATTRERFASLQRGMREGRAASSADKGDGTSDVPPDG